MILMPSSGARPRSRLARTLRASPSWSRHLRRLSCRQGREDNLLRCRLHDGLALSVLANLLLGLAPEDGIKIILSRIDVLEVELVDGGYVLAARRHEAALH